MGASHDTSKLKKIRSTLYYLYKSNALLVGILVKIESTVCDLNANSSNRTGSTIYNTIRATAFLRPQQVQLELIFPNFILKSY